MCTNLCTNVLLEAGLKVKINKCVFFQNSITYLGFIIDKDGIRVTEDKIEAI